MTPDLQQPPDEPDDHALKRYEEFYRYARVVFNDTNRRWEAADEKTSKYLTLLGLVLGAVVFSVEQAASVLSRVDEPLEILFLSAYAGTVGSASFAFVFFLRSIALQDQQIPPGDLQIREHFRSNTYVDVLYSMAVAFLNAAEENTAGVNRKFVDAARGFLMLKVTAFWVLVASNSYFWIHAIQAVVAH